MVRSPDNLLDCIHQANNPHQLKASHPSMKEFVIFRSVAINLIYNGSSGWWWSMRLPRVCGQKKLRTTCDMWNHSQCVCSRQENTCGLERTRQDTITTTSNSIPSKRSIVILLLVNNVWTCSTKLPVKCHQAWT